MHIGRSNKIVGTTIAIIGFFASECAAQTWDVSFSAGVASYSFDELKDYQAYIKDETVTNATITEAFPAYLIYSINLSKQIKKFILGIEGVHGSTGGRVYYEDYSGRFVADQNVRYNQVGLTAAFTLFEKNNFQIAGGLKTSLIFYTLDIENSLTLGTETISENKAFGSINLAFQPHVVVKKAFGNFFFSGSLGYEVQNISIPETKDDDKLFLAGKDNEPVRLQGNGVRLTCGVGFRF